MLGDEKCLVQSEFISYFICDFLVLKTVVPLNKVNRIFGTDGL